MANYRGHIVGGVLAGAAYTAVLIFVPLAYFAEAAGILQGWQSLAAVFVLAVLFGLFPDVDTNSKAQDIFLGLAFITDVVAADYYAPQGMDARQMSNVCGAAANFARAVAV